MKASHILGSFNSRSGLNNAIIHFFLKKMAGKSINIIFFGFFGDFDTLERVFLTH